MPNRIQFSDAIEPLVQFIEETPPAEILDGTLAQLHAQPYGAFLVALVAAGTIQAATSVNLTNLRLQLAFRNSFHTGLQQALAATPVRDALKANCGPLSLPNNKLIPDAQWILGANSQKDIIARSQARSRSRRRERGSGPVVGTTTGGHRTRAEY